LEQSGHPSNELLERYAAGALAAAPAIVISAHIEHCELCRGGSRQVESRYGEKLEALPDAAMAPDALQRALARIQTPVEPVKSQLGDVPLPDAVARLGLRSRRFLSPGFWIAPVQGGWRDRWRLYLLRAPAGTPIPDHRHRGQEIFQVLVGAVRDGRVHRSGDFAAFPADADHSLQVTDDGPCACLVAAEHGARWKGLTQVLSPLLGI
jgi:putative transcriptional regulator